jgi:hypothetical protein
MTPDNDPARMTERSFPEARMFLLTEIVGPNYPVKHLIEQARNKGHITKGKPGRGAGIVTSRDMAMLMCGTLAGDTPQTATDAMQNLAILRANTDAFDTGYLSDLGLVSDWWTHSFIDVITLIIDDFRNDPFQTPTDMAFSVEREPYFCGRLTWNNIPYERDEFLTFSVPEERRHIAEITPLRRLSASYSWEALRNAADWLDGRDEH